MTEAEALHPLVGEAYERNLRMISACAHTLSTVRESVFDPVFVDRRADLLVAVEDLFNEALTLAMDVRAIAWPDHLPVPPTSENETE